MPVASWCCKTWWSELLSPAMGVLSDTFQIYRSEMGLSDLCHCKLLDMRHVTGIFILIFFVWIWDHNIILNKVTNDTISFIDKFEWNYSAWPDNGETFRYDQLDILGNKGTLFGGNYHFLLINDHFKGPSVHCGQILQNNTGKGQSPPPFLAMPGFWEHLEPLPEWKC